MSARHTSNNAIDTSHPLRAFLVLVAVAVGVPAGLLHEQAGGDLNQSSPPLPATAADVASGGTHPNGGRDA
ncbi:hypothetical protein [Streptomyces netropsis]|uniref:Uncharacterized protein n=1 Tax=Streptomyces netropsis TaxID=55404 RepID=A0A7W7LIP4_STRNE|nr:hypothetical protein [Streptomyces netropsis]MBB4890428.1 hypothetical protein [Streptomyces netropsis]GGR45985.1 hypothetical protein GCM10010219_59490 [Streptomyces netropsis]